MTPLERVLAGVGVLAVLAGATYGAYELYEPDVSFAGLQVEVVEEDHPTVAVGETFTRTLRLIPDDPRGNVTFEVQGLRLVAPTEPVPLDTGTIPIEGNRTAKPVALVLEVPLDAPAGALRARASVFVDGKPAGSATFEIIVQIPELPEITLEALAPAAIAGTPVTVLVTLTSTSEADTPVNLTLPGLVGTVRPQRVQVPAGATAYATADITPGPNGIDGILQARAGSETRDVPIRVPAAGTELHAKVLIDEIVASADDRVAVPVILASGASASGTLLVEGGNAVPAEVAFPGVQGLFLEFEGLAAGPREVGLSVGGLTTTVRLTVTAPTGAGAAQGEDVELHYVGRFPSGPVFDTSRIGVALGPFPKTETFTARAPDQYQAFTTVLQEGQTIEGFWRGIVGMAPLQLRTIEMQPEDAYGAEWVEERAPLTWSTERTRTVPLFIPNVPRAAFENPNVGVDLDAVGEGNAFEYSPREGIVFTFTLVRLDEQSADVHWDLLPGDHLTLIPIWPNATEVQSLDGDNATLVTTPPQDAFTTPFTFFDSSLAPHPSSWGNATVVANVTDAAINYRATPPEAGTEYQSAGGFGPPASYRVVGVDGDEVVLERRNDHPLGGRVLVFDITRVS